MIQLLLVGSGDARVDFKEDRRTTTSHLHTYNQGLGVFSLDIIRMLEPLDEYRDGSASFAITYKELPISTRSDGSSGGTTNL